MEDKIKQLQCLCAWAIFYRENKRFDDLDKTQIQIEDFKTRNNLQ